MPPPSGIEVDRNLWLFPARNLLNPATIHINGDTHHMSEWRSVRLEIRGAPREDTAILITTFLLTVLVDLTVAIAVGMVLAVFLFMKRMADTTTVAAIAAELRRDADEGEETRHEARRARVPRDVEVYDINGPFFFGAAESFKDALRRVNWKPPGPDP